MTSIIAGSTPGVGAQFVGKLIKFTQLDFIRLIAKLGISGIMQIIWDLKESVAIVAQQFVSFIGPEDKTMIVCVSLIEIETQ